MLALHLSDLGGEANTSEAEKAIARHAACLIVELEQMEVRFATGDEPEGEETTGNNRQVSALRQYATPTA